MPRPKKSSCMNITVQNVSQPCSPGAQSCATAQRTARAPIGLVTNPSALTVVNATPAIWHRCMEALAIGAQTFGVHAVEVFRMNWPEFVVRTHPLPPGLLLVLRCSAAPPLSARSRSRTQQHPGLRATQVGTRLQWPLPPQSAPARPHAARPSHARPRGRALRLHQHFFGLSVSAPARVAWQPTVPPCGQPRAAPPHGPERRPSN